MKTIVNAELVHLLDPFVGREATRYYLNGVHVEPHPNGGAFLVATDGHRMGIFHDELAICEGHSIIRLPSVMVAACRPGKNKKMRFLTVEGKTAMVHEHPLVTDPEKINHDHLVPEKMLLASGDAVIDGDFPEWRRVVPQTLPAGQVGALSANPRYLADFGKIAPGISLHVQDQHSPIVVKINARTDFVGIIMPMRAEPWTEYPRWLGITPKPAQPAKKAPAKKRAVKTKTKQREAA